MIGRTAPSNSCYFDKPNCCPNPKTTVILFTGCGPPKLKKFTIHAFAALVTVSALTTLGQAPGIISDQGKLTVNGTNFSGVAEFDDPPAQPASPTATEQKL